MDILKAGIPSAGNATFSNLSIDPVPLAEHANHAVSADTATTAITATNSTNATNATTAASATSVTGVVALANGGTGATSAAAALTNLLPSQAGNSGKVLTSNGTSASWSGVTSFSGALAGDVTGTQSATTVATVGGSTAANLHTAELSANAATNLNTANTIVKRDGTGNFTAGTVTANVIGNVTGNATNVTGTVAVANGGTGATTAPTARVNLGAAASGANTDITSVALTGAGTALNVTNNASVGGTLAVTGASTLTGGATIGSATALTKIAGPMSWTLPITVKSGNYTATSSDYMIEYDTWGGTPTLTLPTPVGITGRIYVVIMINSGRNLIVQTLGGSIIDSNTGATGQTSVTIPGPGGGTAQTFWYISDGVRWIGLNR